MRKTGTIARGIRLPIINPNDHLESIVVNSLLSAGKQAGFEFNDRDIVGITESIVAKAQNNFVTLNDIKNDVEAKFDRQEVGVVFPITSRNRFLNILKGIALGSKKVHILLSYPQDEVGNPVCDIEKFYDIEEALDKSFFTEAEFRSLFGDLSHHFTGVDYVALYKQVAPNIEIYFSNNPKDILKVTTNVITAEIHKKEITKKRLEKAGATKVYTLADILATPSEQHGYNPQYGLLGSNISTKDTLKLFPRDCQTFVDGVQKQLLLKTGKMIEVFVYGDGAFKDPVCGIWELADPVVSPGYTHGLIGTPSELKLKYIADDHLASLSAADKEAKLIEMIAQKQNTKMQFEEGTTPRRYTDLLGSLCDLLSGSGDKGTPVVFIQGYFDDFSSK